MIFFRRKTVQQMIQGDMYDWPTVFLRFLKFLLIFSFPVIVIWNYVDIARFIYGVFGSELVGYGPDQQRWYRILLFFLLAWHLFNYVVIVVKVIKGEKKLPDYRARELRRVIYNVDGCNGIEVDSFCAISLEKRGNIKKFSGLSGRQVVNYFMELTGVKQLPDPVIFYRRKKHGKFLCVEKLFIYEVESKNGLFRLRGVDFSTDYASGKIRWAIELPWQAISVKIYSDFSVYNHEVNWGKWELHFE